MGVTLFGDQAPINPTEQAFGFENLTSGVADRTAAENALANSPTAELWRTTQLQQAENGYFVPDETGGGIQVDPQSSLLDPKMATEKYGIKGTLSWDKPVREETAKLQQQYAEERIKREDVLRRAQSGFLPGTARLAASLGASMLDPINIASGFVPVVGEARFAALGAIGSRLARGAVEGAVGQGLIEPINWMNADAEQRDYSMGQVLQDLAFGAGLGATLHMGAYGIGRIRDALHGVPEFTPPADHAEALSGAIAALSEDRPVRVAEYLSALSARRRADLQGTTALGTVFNPEPEVTAPETVGFTTAKGSTYVINPDGTTTRNKAFRPEHGVDEQGPQPTSHQTFYATPDEAEKLGMFQTQGAGKLSVQRFDNGTAAVRYDEGPNAGKYAQTSLAQVSDRPAVGLIPIETWNDGARVHFGNAIVNLTGQAEDAATTAIAGQSAVTDLPDTAGTSFQEAWQSAAKAQAQSHAVQPEHALVMDQWNREAPVAKMRQAPETDASDAEAYAAQTDEVLQGIRDKGLLEPIHEAALAAADEDIRLAEQRGRGLTQAAACIGRALE